MLNSNEKVQLIEGSYIADDICGYRPHLLSAPFFASASIPFLASNGRCSQGLTTRDNMHQGIARARSTTLAALLFLFLSLSLRNRASTKKKQKRRHRCVQASLLCVRVRLCDGMARVRALRFGLSRENHQCIMQLLGP